MSVPCLPFRLQDIFYKFVICRSALYPVIALVVYAELFVFYSWIIIDV